MNETLSSLEASIQEKLDADTDFQTSLADLSDEDKETAIQTKKSELIDSELASLKEKADKLAKAEEVAKNQKIRAEKAEQELKKVKPAGEEPPKANVSLADLAAITNAKVHEEDIERVEKFAKTEGISIKEALKNDELQAILKIREEKRNVANNTNMGTTKRSSAKISDDTLLSNAQKGIMPESDEDMQRLISLRKPKKN